MERWLENAEAIAGISGLSDTELVRIVVLNAREVAQTWALEIVKHQSGIEWQTFKRECRERFASQHRTLEAMSRFFATESCGNREDYQNLLKNADLLANNGAIKLELLLKNVIARALADI